MCSGDSWAHRAQGVCCLGLQRGGLATRPQPSRDGTLQLPGRGRLPGGPGATGLLWNVGRLTLNTAHALLLPLLGLNGCLVDPAPHRGQQEARLPVCDKSALSLAFLFQPFSPMPPKAEGFSGKGDVIID